jgi:hypothetical protein
MSDESSFSSSDFGTPFRALVDHCEAQELRFTADPADKSVQFFIVGDCAIYNVFLRITHDNQVLQVCVRFPVVARDEKVRPLVTEMVTRANHGLPIGHMDFNLDGGEVCYHAGQVITGDKLDDALIGPIVSTALSTSDVYFTAFMRIMFGGHTAEDAVYLAELARHSEAVEENPPAAKQQPGPTSATPKLPAKRKKRRLRRSRHSKSAQELPGLFAKPPEAEPPKGNAPTTNQDPPARGE